MRRVDEAAEKREGAAVVGDPRLSPPDVPSRGLFDAIVRRRFISREYPKCAGIDGICRASFAKCNSCVSKPLLPVLLELAEINRYNGRQYKTVV